MGQRMELAGDFPPFSFLEKLTSSERENLKTIAHRHILKKGNYVFQASNLNDSIWILLEGRVKIIRLSHEGRELIQWFCMPGEIFGLSEGKQTPYRGLYAQTISQSSLISIARPEFDQFLLTHPHLALLIVKQIASRLRTLGDLLLNMSNDDAQSKFVKLLKRLCDCYGVNKGSGIYIDIHLTHQEMADMIGVCRQTVSSMLGELKRRGLLTTNRSGIHIQSIHTLNNIVSA